MKKILFVLFLVSCGILRVYAEIPAKIQSAKVYLQGAELTHLAQINLSPGEQKLIFTGIAGQIDDRSIRITANRAGITLLGYELRQNYLKSNDQLPEIIALKDSIAHYNERLEDHKAKSEVLTQEQQMILANKQVGGTSGLTVAELQKLASFYQTRLSDLNIRILQAKRIEKQILEKIKLFQQQIENRKAAMADYTNELVVDVLNTEKGVAKFEIQYTTPSVYWEPFYDVKAMSLDKPLTLIAKARVIQQTAIDWENVQIAISSAVPTQYVNKPVLNPWVLDFMQEYAPQTGAAPKVYRAETAVMDAEGGFMNLRSNVVSKQVNYLNYEYRPSDRVTIRHNEAKLVTLEEKLLKNSYGHYATPRQQAEVLLMAYVTDWQELNLLPGNARIYLENNLVGESWMNFQSADSDTLELSLGIDKRVQVKFDQKVAFTSDRKMGSSRTKEFKYAITVRNAHQSPIKLILEDRIPVSANKDIEVFEVKLGSGQLQDDKGLVRWRLNLQANGTEKLDYSFSIKYPKNKTVANL